MQYEILSGQHVDVKEIPMPGKAPCLISYIYDTDFESELYYLTHSRVGDEPLTYPLGTEYKGYHLNIADVDGLEHKVTITDISRKKIVLDID